MFVELIATVFAGIAMAGVVLLLNRLTGGRLPRWLMPVAAGLAMIATTISNEYTWFARTSGNLPDGLQIALTVENRSFYRPWTYVVPYVQRFVAVDTATMRTNPALPGQRMADLYLFGRWAAVNKVPMLFDCDGNRRASLSDGASFDDTGAVSDARWVTFAPNDPVQKAVCEES